MTRRKDQLLYHLTRTSNTESILRDGLRASADGAIYAFTDLIVANTIARDQVSVREYALFEILRISGPLEPDDVAELSRGYHRRLIQSVIAPRHLRYLGVRQVVTEAPTEWDYVRGQRLWGRTRAQVDEEFAVRRAQWADVRAFLEAQAEVES